MTDLAKHSTTPHGGPSPDAEEWRAKADPDLGYAGNEGSEEDPPAEGDQDMPMDPPPPMADQEFAGNEGSEEDPPAEGDQDQPGDPPPPEVAETNGR